MSQSGEDWRGEGAVGVRRAKMERGFGILLVDEEVRVERWVLTADSRAREAGTGPVGVVRVRRMLPIAVAIWRGMVRGASGRERVWVIGGREEGRERLAEVWRRAWAVGGVDGSEEEGEGRVRVVW